MRKLIWSALVMMFLLSISALAEVCSSTNQLLEGEAQTYRFCPGNESRCAAYDIVPLLIGYDDSLDKRYVSFVVNGENIAKLNEGESFTLTNGADLSVKEILYQAYAGGIHAVWFCLDGEKGENQAKAVVNEKETSPVTMKADLSNYPELFFKSGVFNSYFVVGWKAPPMDNLAMTDIAAGLEEKSYTISNAAKLDSEINNPLNTNLIVIGKPSENTVANLLFGGVSNYLKPGEGMIKLFENNGYVQMLVTGYSAEDTRKAAKVLQDYQDYNLAGKEIIVSGTISEPQIKASALPIIVEPVEPVIPVTLPQPEPTPQVATPKEAACDGCKPNGNCLPYGTRLVKDGKQVYCSIDGKLQEQQTLGNSCQNNYECSSNQCSNAKCIDLSGQIEEAKGILEKIFAWLKRVFG